MSSDLLEAVRCKDSLDDMAYYLDYEDADVNFRDANGITALMEAAMNLDIVRMRFLLHRGARIDMQDNKKRTALNHVYADYQGDNEGALFLAIDFLLAECADPTHNYEDGDTLLNWAASNRYARIIRHILSIHTYTENELWDALELVRGVRDIESLLEDKMEAYVDIADNTVDIADNPTESQIILIRS